MELMGRRFLLYELGCYCAWLVFFTTFTLLFQQEDWTMTFWETMADRCVSLCGGVWVGVGVEADLYTLHQCMWGH